MLNFHNKLIFFEICAHFITQTIIKDQKYPLPLFLFAKNTIHNIDINNHIGSNN